MNHPQILVTGAGGFLGGQVLPSLAAEGTVTVLSRKPMQGLSTITGDLTASDLSLGHKCFSAVYHLAGWAHRVPRTEGEREMFFRVNAGGTRNLLRALQQTGQLPQCFVLVSTVAVYGVEAGILLDETTAARATDAYGASKREAEEAVIDWGERHGVRVGIARLPLVAGRRAPGNLGAMVRALRRGRYLGIGSGSARRSMVWAADVGRILPRLAAGGGVFHLTDGQHPSFAELEAALAGALGCKTPWRMPMGLAKAGAWTGNMVNKVTGRNVPLNTRSLTKMTSTLTFSDERARKELGWNPSRVLDHAAELVNEAC
jgi:nucleoside-diphosphate-sugar epimerase